MPTSVPMERSTPAPDAHNPAPPASSAFDRAKLFRARLAATRSNIASSSGGEAGASPTAVVTTGITAPSQGEPQSEGEGGVKGRDGEEERTTSVQGSNSGRKTTTNAAHGTMASRAPSASSSRHSPAFSPSPLPSFASTPSSRALPQQQPLPPVQPLQQPYISPYPIPPPGAVSAYSPLPPHTLPQLAEQPLAFAAVTGQQVLASFQEQQQRLASVPSTFLPSPVAMPATRPLSTAMFTAPTSDGSTSHGGSLRTSAYATVLTSLRDFSSPDAASIPVRRASVPAVTTSFTPAAGGVSFPEPTSPYAGGISGGWKLSQAAQHSTVASAAGIEQSKQSTPSPAASPILPTAPNAGGLSGGWKLSQATHHASVAAAAGTEQSKKSAPTPAASPVLPAALKPVDEQLLKSEEGACKTHRIATPRLDATSAPFSPALSSPSLTPTFTTAPPSLSPAHPSLPLKPSPTPSMPAAAPLPPALAPLFSLAAFERDHGGAARSPRETGKRACEVLGIERAVVEAMEEEEGVDAAVLLRRAERVEGELVKSWKKILPGASVSAPDKAPYASHLQSLLYLLLTLPSLPTFSSFTSSVSTNPPGPLIEPLVDSSLRLVCLTAGDAADASTLGGARTAAEQEREKEARRRILGAAESWLREVERLKGLAEKASKTVDQSTADELRDARHRISKLDTRLTTLQGELKVAQGDGREWKERAVKAEGRLEEKPSRRVALLLEQVDSLTASRSALQAELAIVQSGHDEVAAELLRLRAASGGGGGASDVDGGAAVVLISPETEKAREKELAVLQDKIKKLEVQLQLKDDAAEADQLIFADKEATLAASLKDTKTRLAQVEGQVKDGEVKAQVEKREWERERKEREKREGESKREVLRLKDRERELEAKVPPGAYPPSPEKNRSSAAGRSSSPPPGPSATEERLRTELESVTSQLRKSKDEVQNNKYVISKLAGQVKSLNREVSEKVEENAELMIRLATEDA
ncbi:hypothetical protein JCM6882_001091 [Rhodosporidiobolus microsporus]